MASYINTVYILKKKTMKTKFTILLLISFICAGFVSCSDDDDDDERVFNVIISSVQKVYNTDFGFSPYFGKQAEDDAWKPFDNIEGFEHEEGYEYILKLKQAKHPDRDMADAPVYKYTLLEVLSKVKKESENIPIQGIHMIIASERPKNTASPSYYVSYMGGDWKILEQEIEDFEYEEGYEYSIYAGLTFLGHYTTPKYSYSVIETYSKEKKESIALPGN